MSKTRRTQIILLLADGFDEAVVGIMLTTLRQAGLAVRLVGLRSSRLSGAHGLVIVPDLGLDKLLAGVEPISALLLPGGAGHLARLRVDSRVNKLIQKSIGQEAILIGLENRVTKMLEEFAKIKGASIEVVEPEPGGYLEEFAGSLARQLLAMTAC